MCGGAFLTSDVRTQARNAHTANAHSLAFNSMVVTAVQSITSSCFKCIVVTLFGRESTN